MITKMVEDVMQTKEQEVAFGLALGGHVDNATKDNEYMTDRDGETIIHFDAPIYLITLVGEATFSQGLFQQGNVYDASQTYKVKPGTILRCEGFSFWDIKHRISSVKGQRVILISRPIHNYAMRKVLN